jgi:hypothetical protein
MDDDDVDSDEEANQIDPNRPLYGLRLARKATRADKIHVCSKHKEQQ